MHVEPHRAWSILIQCTRFLVLRVLFLNWIFGENMARRDVMLVLV